MRYRAVILAVCVFATACGKTANSPTSPTSAIGGFDQSPLTPQPRSFVESLDRPQARGGSQLPFRGSLEALEVDVVVPPNLMVNGTATGTGTHLGRFSATFTVTVTLATGSGIGNITLTAANGDRVDATFVGQGTPTTEPNIASIVEVATINAGTGRFAGATGTFTIRRVLNQVTGVSSGSFDGIIDLGH